MNLYAQWGVRGGTVVKVLRHKSQGSLVRFQLVSLEFFINIDRTMALGFYSASNRNEYQEHFLAGA